MRIKSLQSGGIITNYYCTSTCKHCLYNCSPSWKKDYITDQTLANDLRIIKKLNCRSIHIGGGEPFLYIEGLKNIIFVSK